MVERRPIRLRVDEGKLPVEIDAVDADELGLRLQRRRALLLGDDLFPPIAARGAAAEPSARPRRLVFALFEHLARQLARLAGADHLVEQAIGARRWRIAVGLRGR